MENWKILVLALGLFASIQVQGEEMSSGQKLAMRLEAMLEKMESTVYQARTDIDEKTLSDKCDCSGLVCYLLRSDYPIAYKQLDGVESPWRARPFSVTFYETFIRAGEEKLAGWQRVRKLMDARPGDIMAWRKKKIAKGVSTGHTLVIVDQPKMEKDGRVRVKLIDSTRKIHAEDSRPEGTNGVGSGVMWFEVNEEGEPVRLYIDGSGKRSQIMLIAIGRLK